MLSTGYVPLAASALALFVALWALFYVHQAANRLWEYAQTHQPRTVALSKLAEHDAALTELTDAYDALLESHKKLRSRIGMRKNRERSADELDPNDPRWKEKARQKLVREGKLNARFHLGN